MTLAIIVAYIVIGVVVGYFAGKEYAKPLENLVRPEAFDVGMAVIGASVLWPLVALYWFVVAIGKALGAK